ncbi:MAG: hypothetical protein WD063_07310 [Pirellulales bacterium]
MAQAAVAKRGVQPARPSRAALVRQALASFAAVVGCYWLYWLVAVPLIEPGVEDRPVDVASQEEIDAARGDVTSRQREVARYFSPDDWEADKPTIWQSGEMRLLFKSVRSNPDGTVKLRPCTLMFFPKSGGSSPAKPVIMRAVQGADIRFDEPIVLRSVDPRKRKFVGANLIGPIRIYREASAPGAGDDVEITTPRDVEMTADRAWTAEPVNFRFGRSYGSGRDLEILLGPPPGGQQTDVMRGATFRTLKLKRDVRMRLEMGSGPPAADAHERPPNSAEPPIEITCRGPFAFEMEDYAASFHDKVDVFRLNAAGESDQLNCSLLTVYFARPGEALEAAPQPAGGNSTLTSQVRLIEARGDPVTMRSPAQGMYARCKGVDYIPGPPGTPGSLAAFGPGVIHGNLPNDPAGKYVAQWARELRFEPDGPLERVTLRGATVLEIAQMGTITADEVFAWLSRKPPAPNRPAAQVALNRGAAAPANADAWQIERIVARRYPQPAAQSQGDVVIDAPQLYAVAGTLEATIERRPPAQAQPAPAVPANHEPPPRARQRPPQNPAERYEVTGRDVHIRLVPQGEKLAVAGATIEHDAEIKRLSAAGGKNETSLLVKGDRLHVTDANTEATKVTIAGNPGYVEAGGMTLWGAAINLESQFNRLWISGPGRLTMPITQDLDGQALPQPQFLAVDWKTEMDFRSDTAVFEGTVVARTEQQHLDTDKLEAVLTRAVDFARAGAAVGKQGERPELAKMRSYGRTLLESRQIDDGGVQSAFSRMELLDLSVDRTSGKIGGRGPGWVTHVTRGGPQIAGPPGPGDAQRAPPIPPDKQFTYLHVTFRRGIDGDINRREIRFFDHTKTIYGPVTDWNATLDGRDPAALGQQGMVLEAGALEVREMNRREHGKRGWFELDASGGVVAEGQRFTAIGDRLTYAEEKDRLILRGDPAEMFLENESGPRNETRAKEVGYWFKRHYVAVSGAQLLDLELPADAQKKLFEGRQPNPPAAPPPR